MSLYTSNQSKCCPFHEPHIVVEVIVECCTLHFYQGSLCSSSFACTYKTVGYYHGYQWFLVSQLQKFLGLCGATTLGLYRAMTLLPYGSSNLRLYNSMITNNQIRNSTALQLYNATTLRVYGTLGLYGSMALWLYSSVITTFTALWLCSSTILRLYGSMLLTATCLCDSKAL